MSTKAKAEEREVTCNDTTGILAFTNVEMRRKRLYNVVQMPCAPQPEGRGTVIYCLRPVIQALQQITSSLIIAAYTAFHEIFASPFGGHDNCKLSVVSYAISWESYIVSVADCPHIHAA